MKNKTNPKDSKVCRKHFVPNHSTPMGSHITTGYNFYKHAIPSGLLTGLKQFV